MDIILAYPFDSFIDHWNEEDKNKYYEALPKYNKLVCVSLKPFRGVYFARNRYLVDHSAYCIAYCTSDTGGTAYTLRYARSKNLKITNIAY